MSQFWEAEKHNYNQQWDSNPVYYCTECLSLAISGEIEGCEYCQKCGSPEIAQDNIQHWEDKYIKRFGHKYLEEY